MNDKFNLAANRVILPVFKLDVDAVSKVISDKSSLEVV